MAVNTHHEASICCWRDCKEPLGGRTQRKRSTFLAIMNSNRLRKCATQCLRLAYFLQDGFYWVHSKGIGAITKSTVVLSSEEEKKLWDAGALSLDTPTGLLRVVFFYNG